MVLTIIIIYNYHNNYNNYCFYQNVCYNFWSRVSCVRHNYDGQNWEPRGHSGVGQSSQVLSVCQPAECRYWLWGHGLGARVQNSVRVLVALCRVFWWSQAGWQILAVLSTPSTTLHYTTGHTQTAPHYTLHTHTDTATQTHHTPSVAVSNCIGLSQVHCFNNLNNWLNNCGDS